MSNSDVTIIIITLNDMHRYYGAPPYQLIGYTSLQRNVTASSVTISGIPFVKVVVEDFTDGDYSANPSCPPFFANPATSLTPVINLHTY